jgi:hypothetical protein
MSTSVNDLFPNGKTVPKDDEIIKGRGKKFTRPLGLLDEIFSDTSFSWP